MKKFLTIFGAIGFVVLLGLGFAFFVLDGEEYEVRISGNQIRTALDARLPVTKRYLYVVEATYRNPRVVLPEGTARITVGLDADVRAVDGKKTDPVTCSADVSTGVAFNASTGEFFLTDFQVDRLDVEHVRGGLTRVARKALGAGLRKVLNEIPIYQLQARDVKTAVAKLVLKNVEIENGDVVVTLGI